MRLLYPCFKDLNKPGAPLTSDIYVLEDLSWLTKKIHKIGKWSHLCGSGSGGSSGYNSSSFSVNSSSSGGGGGPSKPPAVIVKFGKQDGVYQTYYSKKDSDHQHTNSGSLHQSQNESKVSAHKKWNKFGKWSNYASFHAIYSTISVVKEETEVLPSFNRLLSKWCIRIFFQNKNLPMVGTSTGKPHRLDQCVLVWTSLTAVKETALNCRCDGHNYVQGQKT